MRLRNRNGLFDVVMFYAFESDAQSHSIVLPLFWSVFVDMKIHQIIILGLVGILFLSACAPDSDPPVTENSSTVSSTTEPPLSSSITSTRDPDIVDPPIVPSIGGIGEKSDRYDVVHEGKNVLSVSLSLPEASVTGNDSLQATLTARLEAIEADINGYIQALSEKYKEDILSGRDMLATPTISVRFSLNYFTSEAASLTYFYNETTSDGRVISYTRFCNVDLRVGSEIVLAALLNSGADEQLILRVRDAVRATDTVGLYEGQKELIAELLDSTWYMTTTALAFRFSPGDLAPVNSGEILVTLEKEAIADLLSSYGSALIGNTDEDRAI